MSKLRDEQEAEYEQNRRKNQAVSIGRILLDALHSMTPGNRVIVFDAIIADFCIQCGHDRMLDRSGVCECW